MITVKIQHNASGYINMYKVEGHSAVAPKGYDIICAGVSTLVQTTLYGLRDYLRFELDYSIDEGDFYVKIKSQPNMMSETLIETMIIGLDKLAELAPEVVEVKYLN